MTPRNELKALIAANGQTIATEIDNFWRRFAEDLIAGGVPKKTVIESMMAVAHTQGMIAFGATEMAERMRGCADIFESAAARGCEYPATSH
jgi:hypothetical protein